MFVCSALRHGLRLTNLPLHNCRSVLLAVGPALHDVVCVFPSVAAELGSHGSKRLYRVRLSWLLCVRAGADAWASRRVWVNNRHLNLPFNHLAVGLFSVRGLISNPDAQGL